MKNITYLLGAGASVEALPVVEKIHERLLVFEDQFSVKDLKSITVDNDVYNLATKYLYAIKNDKIKLERTYETIKLFHKDITWLRKETYKHTSIDTFAKKLYLQGNKDLKKLKYILSCFFIYEQTLKFDKRYDSFFASILESLDEFPTNIKIVSWNYDSQFEIAFSRFTNSTIEKSRKTLNIFSKGNQVDNLSNKEDFSVFKINGTTSVIDREKNPYDIIIDYDIDEVNLTHSFLEIFGSSLLYRNHNPNMSFAWENFNSNNKFFQSLQKATSETDILIVIGYSFPFFNRKVDKLLLDSMSRLEKVYVQDPYKAKDVIEKIEEFFPYANIKDPGRISRIIEFKEILNKDQFFIPIEF